MKYHIIYNLCYHYDGQHNASFSRPAYREEFRQETIIDMLPALFIVKLQRLAIEDHDYDPAVVDGKPTKMTVDIVYAQVISDSEANELTTEWKVIADEKQRYEKMCYEAPRSKSGWEAHIKVTPTYGSTGYQNNRDIHTGPVMPERPPERCAFGVVPAYIPPRRPWYEILLNKAWQSLTTYKGRDGNTHDR